MIFDTHAHYDDHAFDDDRDALLLGLKTNGIGAVIIPGCDAASSETVSGLAEQYPGVWFAAGIHPEELPADLRCDIARVEALLTKPRCVAVGEIGLDYYWDTTKKAEQKELLRLQLELALKYDKPVIIHDREAHGDCLEILGEFQGLRGVFHCYSGSAEMAQELLKKGWYLGFDGPVTYKNARKIPEVLEICPPDRLLIETDSPYMSPVPLRGKRNDSRNLRYVIDRIAELKGTTPECIETMSYENACRLFGIENPQL